ncbi:phage gp6-like head-tail connector protein [Streptomyces alkaliterrae]|uniref:Phage gp6-like head-tail connector protein n=1 Tax=Streptomyces alkaliterrae TaxID=2213162 RepID=A0A5P0YIX0_9ACTN|nr:phage gp6-like head-tail connector protein [Streptomyces alkaliterrae]MBB1251839.1 phage gp6-like head-tail connector protein [Streptomyces alkaliterrae]MBB1259298.1 phage gp6-like head-tail connector protein [Streptomyces alkaliterrae]MQS00324.1 hypothetical protein [Streptomyces alkaliterrae]
MSYATVEEVRALDGMDDASLFSDETLTAALAYAIETVESYCGRKWEGGDVPPETIRWCVRTLARQFCLDLVSRVPDRALQMQSEFGTIQLAQAGGPWRPTSLPEVNAHLNRYRVRLPFIVL